MSDTPRTDAEVRLPTATVARERNNRMTNDYELQSGAAVSSSELVVPSRPWTLEEKLALSVCFDTMLAILPEVPVERQMEYLWRSRLTTQAHARREQRQSHDNT